MTLFGLAAIDLLVLVLYFGPGSIQGNTFPPGLGGQISTYLVIVKVLTSELR